MERSTILASPRPEDGAEMWRLATASGLDLNSPYKYLLFCRDFADTSIVARIGDRLGGFVTGYVRPHTQTLFVWQVGVAEEFRRRGLALAMLRALWQGAVPDLLGVPIDHLEATFTPANLGSRRLFEAFARWAEVPMRTEVLFAVELFPEPHGPEVLLRIGPIPPTSVGVNSE
ncbi:MAG: diaminobutyrate acetyltransferase [Acidimicrobiales bacterium]